MTNDIFFIIIGSQSLEGTGRGKDSHPQFLSSQKHLPNDDQGRSIIASPLTDKQ